MANTATAMVKANGEIPPLLSGVEPLPINDDRGDPREGHRYRPSDAEQRDRSDPQAASPQ